MRFLFKSLSYIVFFFLAIFAISHLAGQSVSHTTKQFIRTILPAAPCTEPIRFNIGDFDEEFGITKEQFVNNISKAGDIWEDNLNRQLFIYSTSSPDLTINLIYDYRQKATLELKKIGITIKNDKDGYETLKAKYDSLHKEYESKKVRVSADLKNYNDRKSAYQTQVSYWNQNGGAPQEEYEKLQAELYKLNNDADRINTEQRELNELVNNLNSIVPLLNQIAKELNLHVNNYNSIGSITGREFNEGEYVEDESGKYINIYQFSNQTQLIRVLEHELGHALGLNHVEDTKAIMYRLNQGTNEKLTSADIGELNRICKISNESSSD